MVIVTEISDNPTCTSGFLSSLHVRLDQRQLHLVTRIRKLHLQLALSFSHFLFLQDCMENNLTPHGLRFHRFHPQNSSESRWKRKIEQERTKLTCKNASKRSFSLRHQITSLKSELTPNLEEELLNKVKNYWQNTYNSTFLDVQKTKANKFNKLILEKDWIFHASQSSKGLNPEKLELYVF